MYAECWVWFILSPSDSYSNWSGSSLASWKQSKTIFVRWSNLLLRSSIWHPWIVVSFCCASYLSCSAVIKKILFPSLHTFADTFGLHYSMLILLNYLWVDLPVLPLVLWVLGSKLWSMMWFGALLAGGCSCGIGILHRKFWFSQLWRPLCWGRFGHCVGERMLVSSERFLKKSENNRKTRHDPHNMNSSPRHYQRTPATTDLHTTSKHQKKNNGKKIGEIQGCLFLRHKSHFGATKSLLRQNW